jgi:FkbM family methyltransferase
MLKKKNKVTKIHSFLLKGFSYPLYLRSNTSDFSVFKQIFEDENYYIWQDVKPEVIIDCGANIGLTSVYYKMRYPEAKIICIEPDLSNYEMLIKNTENFHNIVPYNAGVWNKSTNLVIKNPTGDKWAFMVEETAETLPDAIKAVSIENIMKEQNIDFIDILKIDIEGSEVEVFQSNYDYWLSRTRILIIELHDEMKKKCSKTFFEALSKYHFATELRGEDIVCFMEH